MTGYYNEIEPYAADWLRELIKKGLIADGIVDTRSIVAVEAADLRDFDQCHFFAGIGVWSYALRLAGWPDDRPVWTGSCPCQPFSAAGKQKGFEDERHLWPVFHRLISECRPPVVFGEQVASKDGLQWLDAVFADLEGSGYAAGAADLCAAGVGAPHIRQRLWFVGERLADTELHEQRGGRRPGCEGAAGDELRLKPGGCGAAVGLGHHHHQGLEGQRDGHQAASRRVGAAGSTAAAGEPCGLADALRGGAGNDTGEGLGAEATAHGKDGSVPRERLRAGIENASLHDGRPRPTNGYWQSADWLHCRDGKWRPVEPGAFPLAHGAPARVGRLRAYGNAIVPQVAAEVIRAYLESMR